MRDTNRAFIVRHRFRVALLITAIAGALLYIYDLSANPPGFFIDESSIAYNAHTISRTGRDEFGNAWPLFFRAFGEYKNPVHIYLLAALFRFTGPGIFAARCLSGLSGLAAALVLGILAARLSGRRTVALAVGTFALLTPWLFELSRLVVEVTLYPLIVASFLLAVRVATQKIRWASSDIVALISTLALLTYTYSIGRLLGPLLAAGLVCFFSRKRLPGLVMVFAGYALTLIPMLWVRWHRPDVLTGRFTHLTYIASDSSAGEIAREFLRHLLANLNPWPLFVADKSKVNELLHLPNAPAMLWVTGALLIGGVLVLFYRKKLNAWWIFILYGLFASVVPASLTREHFHMLRLSAVPVFIIVLTIPAFIWLTDKDAVINRVLLSLVIVVCLGQATLYHWRYHASARSPQKLHLFDADYPARIFPAALARAADGPIYLADNPARPGYIQAYWYATLQRIPTAKFISLGFDKPAPEGGVVITTEESCPRCRVLAKSEPYTTYVAEGRPRDVTPLPAAAFRSELSVTNPPATLRTGQQTTLQVMVRNASGVTWLARERSHSPFQLLAGNHWLDANGNILINDDGRGSLPDDLRPGETTVIPLVINAPHSGGEYILEVDILQEGVSWFGLRGAKTWRSRVLVE